jgi:hypothetical protein
MPGDSAAGYPDNLGAGLGTGYDSGSDCVSISQTWRPLGDAQMHVTNWHWGSSGGIGGKIGSDFICNGGCPWNIDSGYQYDYAIYVG